MNRFNNDQGGGYGSIDYNANNRPGLPPQHVRIAQEIAIEKNNWQKKLEKDAQRQRLNKKIEQAYAAEFPN